MYESIPGYLKGFIDGGFFWYTLAGVVLFFLYSAMNSSSESRAFSRSGTSTSMPSITRLT